MKMPSTVEAMMISEPIMRLKVRTCAEYPGSVSMSSSLVRIVRPASCAVFMALLSVVRSALNATAETAGDRLAGPC